MGRSFSALTVVALALLLLLGASGAAAMQPLPSANTLAAVEASSSLDLGARLACQRAIEEVYWQQRLWPAENPTSKPALDAVLSPAVLRGRVEDTLRQSNALAARWQQPITGEMLQAELARMAAETRQPEVLRALWAALNNDPALIAECLARPALAERLLRDWYAQDERVHGVLEAQARTEMARIPAPEAMRGASGDYQETTWRQGEPDEAVEEPDTLTLDAVGWAAEQARLGEWFGTAPEAIPVGQVSTLQEDEGGFFALAVLERDEARLRVATLRWAKQPFDTWWAAEKEGYPTTLTPPAFAYRLPEVRGAAGDPTWLPTPALPIRTNGTAVWTGTEMIVWGGGSLGTGRSNDGSRYNPTTDSWYTISAINAPAERFLHTAVWTGTEMIVWGGCGSFEYRLCELGNGGRYNPTTGLWVPVSNTNAPAARLDHTAVWTGSEMIVWGGCAPSTEASCPAKNTGGRYNPSTDTWTATSLTNAPSARTGHTAVWTGSEMIVWGGESGVDITNTGGRYNPGSDSWTPTSTANAPSGRFGHTAVWTGTEMIVWGGCSVAAGCIVQGTPLNTGGRYNPASDTWTPTSLTNAPTPRTGHTAVWTGTEMIVWGGGTSNNIYFNTGGRYNPASDTWTPTGTTNAPSGRAGHQAVWTGSLMIVWGSSRTGGRYDPASNTWTPTSTVDPDAQRSEHVAVWTGAEMIVWGGNDVLNGTVSTGRAYNPTTRTWRAIPTPAIEGRYAHTAVWTGTEMIVWGGLDGPYPFNTGGRYNPTSNSWSLTSTAGAPDARGYHTAVWTGSEMIVWGGAGEESYLETGGRYNPSTNSWSPVSTAGAPPGRYLHTAVWGANRMIVWGGIVATGETNTGGRYDPATNTWSLTSTTNAPTPRHWQSAVWTGDRMIVWGGVADVDNPTNFNSGGRYDPVADTWAATSLDGAPQGRVRHTAVWTGAEMIVWGGCVGLYCGTPLYTGGHYNPTSDTWTLTAIDGGTPRARGEHTAVWTGDRMIVWGGFTDLSTYTNTGAEYLVGGPGPGTPTPTATVALPTATATAVPPTSTATRTVTAVPTSTTTRTVTAVPTNTATRTVTPTVPTASTATRTATTVPPTSTATRTATTVPPTGTSTATTVPPSSTPTVAPPSTTPTRTVTAVPTTAPGGTRLFLPLVSR